ncbi:hypothetical protein ABGB18_05310 [Nonomuraea sp. B12E4]|uniref:hypothetical protein n=1 Tax=Nonomuraea sp. B12E4 TaxID=3153564 RepID=UPI00325D6F72
MHAFIEVAGDIAGVFGVLLSLPGSIIALKHLKRLQEGDKQVAPGDDQEITDR